MSIFKLWWQVSSPWTFFNSRRWCKCNENFMASKPNRWLTGSSVRFRSISIVLNNDNHSEPDGTGGQPAVGFWSRPMTFFVKTYSFFMTWFLLFLTPKMMTSRTLFTPYKSRKFSLVHNEDQMKSLFSKPLTSTPEMLPICIIDLLLQLK